MKKAYGILMLCFALALGLSFQNAAAEDMSMIDNITFDAIKSVKVEGDMLYATIVINNQNDYKIKIKDGSFTFSIGSKLEDANVDDIKEIKVDDIKEIGVENTHSDFEIDPNTEKHEVFELKLQGNPLEGLTHLLNCIGDPSNKRAVAYISGNFKLGQKSDKGWSYARDLGIEWEFKPISRELFMRRGK